MATGRPRTFALCLALAALTPAGCAGPNPFTSHQTTVGGLKASVSQLEFENEKLKKEVGELRVDNSRLDNQLVQEQQANGEIAARLDDAKDLLRRAGNSTAQASMGAPTRNFEDDEIPPPVVTPKSRRVRSSRPSPAVAIPRPAAPRINDDDLSYLNPGRSARNIDRDLGPLDRVDDDRWLPVARGLPSQIRQ
jgi:hypothetical protein